MKMKLILMELWPVKLSNFGQLSCTIRYRSLCNSFEWMVFKLYICVGGNNVAF